MNLEGVDVDWVRTRLQEFISETKAVNQSSSGGGVSIMTARTSPACGRPRAIELGETIRPVLDQLYPDWQAENGTSKNDEFKSERDAAQKLIARLDNHEELKAKLGGSDTSPRITAASLHERVWQAAEPQWSLGQPHEAVLAAAKVINSMLQQRLGRTDASEQDLVRQAFGSSNPAPGKPRLRYPEIADDQTRSSMEQGVMNFGAGCFGAIRNPVGHRPNDEIVLDEQTALEQLAALSLFARWIDQATLVEADVAP